MFFLLLQTIFDYFGNCIQFLIIVAVKAFLRQAPINYVKNFKNFMDLLKDIGTWKTFNLRGALNAIQKLFKSRGISGFKSFEINLL